VTAAGGAGSPAPAPVAGTIAGQPFAPRAAAVRHTSLLGWVLYLLPAEARCGEPTPLGAITPSVVVEVAPRGGGAPAPGTVDPGAVELLQADFSAPGGEVGARASTGITLELATVETARGGHWRGRLRVAPFERGGRRYAYDGRFTATVC
jgi:hypothetical protein